MVEASLYFHIPFCTRKCDYCHFFVLPDKDPFKQQLLRGLKLEWERKLPLLQGLTIVSIYFGGGTPSLLGAPAIGTILNWVKESTRLADPLEITLEANPENITQELMCAYQNIGINRVSIGIQSLDEILLKKLGRLHDVEKALTAVHCTFDAGIKNLSIDLMYDLPGQTLQSWKNTLKRARDLPIKHLSLYNLTIEPHTAFFKIRHQIERELPDENSSLLMYQEAVQLLTEANLKQYEISAFERDGYPSKHNTGYWQGRPFLGYGPSAFSYWEGKRFRNIAHLGRYEQLLEKGESPVDFSEKLEPEAMVRELFAIRLRMLDGVHIEDFQKQFGKLDVETLTTLDKLIREELLMHRGNRVCLTQKGVLFYDAIASELI